MLILLAAILVFFFLAIGALAFILCISIPPVRRYSLSTALWFATWGPCSVLFLVFVLLGLVAGGVALRATQMHWDTAPRLFSAIGWGALLIGILVTCILASAAAWIHQVVIHRFTFFLFRLYATFVVSGIGCVIAMAIVISISISARFPHAAPLSLISVPVLSTAFGMAAYKYARLLRGNAPARFTWITPEEFYGRVEPRQ